MLHLIEKIAREKWIVLKMLLALGLNSYFIYFFISNIENSDVDFLQTNLVVWVYVFNIAYLISASFSLKFIVTSIIVGVLTYLSQMWILKSLYINHESIDSSIFYPLREVSIYYVTLVIAYFLLIRKKVVEDGNVTDELQKGSTIFLGIFINSQFLVALSLISDLYIKVLKSNRFWPILINEEIEFGNILNYTLATYFVLSFIYGICFWGIYNLLCRKQTLSLELLTSLFLAIVFNHAIQSGITVKGNHLGVYLISGATLFQILILSLFFLLVYVVINRYFYATVLIVNIGFIFSYVNKEKYILRSEPILLTDLKWIKELSFLSNYINFSTIIIVILLIAVQFMLAWLLENRLIQERLKKSKIKHFLVSSVVILTFIWINNSFSKVKSGVIPKDIPLLSSVHNVYDIDWQGITTKANFQSLGFVWMKQLTTKTIEEPSEYSQKKINTLYEKYKTRAKEINRNRNSIISDRTVIYILSESFADPTRLPKVKANTNPIPEIKKIGENTTSGLMRSDGYGGGTANMEFQSLMGLPKYHFDPITYILFSDVFPKLK